MSGGVQLAENFIMNTAWRYGRGVRPVHSDNLIAGLVGSYGFEKLLPLGDDITFVPGHGAISTLGRERISNPFLQ